MALTYEFEKKYYEMYDLKWLSEKVDAGEKISCVGFWQAGKEYENCYFSQWYTNVPFVINGREYQNAEKYMMSEKALLFQDYENYDNIMKESDPRKIKAFGRLVKNFDGEAWGKVAREVLFHGNMAKFQSDKELMEKLMQTGDAVLIEASPYDDIYGAGIAIEDLLDNDGFLKVHPQKWHKADSDKIAENKLGFVLMGLREFFKSLQ